MLQSAHERRLIPSLSVDVKSAEGHEYSKKLLFVFKTSFQQEVQAAADETWREQDESAVQSVCLICFLLLPALETASSLSGGNHASHPAEMLFI